MRSSNNADSGMKQASREREAVAMIRHAEDAGTGDQIQRCSQCFAEVH